jgi:hypothetical protein
LPSSKNKINIFDYLAFTWKIHMQCLNTTQKSWSLDAKSKNV